MILDKHPFISVIVPCRNEEKYINGCLDSLISQDYPKEKMEILVVDGASEDNTEEIIKNYAEKYPFVKLFKNPKKITPVSMNIGIKNSRGEIVTKTDAHSVYQSDYISKCVNYLHEYEADAVGGVAKAVPPKNTLVAQAVALTLGSFFGAGGSGFRTGVAKPAWADTAFGICYRKNVFEKTGLYNENLAGSQDVELNLRLKRAGGKILLAPDIVITYYPKSSFQEFFQHNIKDGIWAILPMKYGAQLFKIRHLIPLTFVISILISLVVSFFLPLFLYLFILIVGFYFLTSLFFSTRIALKQKDIKLVPFLLIAFGIRHFGYGFGSFIGLFRLITG